MSRATPCKTVVASPSNHRGPHSATRRDVAALVLAAAAVAGCFGVVRSLATQLRGERAVAMVVIGVRSAALHDRTCEEQNMRHGSYQIRGTGGRPNDVRVDDEGIGVPVEEVIYHTRGYRPPVDELPWEEDYLRQHASAQR